MKVDVILARAVAGVSVINMCELYKDQLLTIQINGNEYYGPIKMLYTTFFDKIINVFYAGKWYPAKIIGEASEKEMYIVGNDELTCSFDLVKRLNPDLDIDKLIYRKTNIKSDWLFGVEFVDNSNKYFTLTNGMIIPSN